MIDNFSLFLTHSLMLLAAWRMLQMMKADPEERGVIGNEGSRQWPKRSKKDLQA